MDFSGQSEYIEERLDAIDRGIPDHIRAQIRPLEQQLRRNRDEFEAFRDQVEGDMESIRQLNQIQNDRHELRIAEHNQLIRVMLNIVSEQQVPRAEQAIIPPRRTRTSGRRGPSQRPNQAQVPENQEAESAIRRRILSDYPQYQLEVGGCVYYHCGGGCRRPKYYKSPYWFFGHLTSCHPNQVPRQ